MIVYSKINGVTVKITDIDAGPGSVSFDDIAEFLTIVTGSPCDVVPPFVASVVEFLNCDPSNWPMLFPAQTRDKIIHETMEKLRNLLSQEVVKKYFMTWVSIREFLNKLSIVKIDEPVWSKNLPKNQHAAKNSVRKGHAKIKYSTCGSATGRLTMTAGPNFLTLPKELRTAIRPHEAGSSIFSIDFSSLEPRVVLFTTKQSCDTEDIYSDVMQICDISDRKIAKLATISALYGASSNRLAMTIGDRSAAKSLLENVSRYFNVPELEEKLACQSENEMVRNYFGRPLREATKNKRIRINHYIQSSAADLANLLFHKFCEQNEYIRPLLVIHDAMIVEVPHCKIDLFLSSSRTIEYDGYQFPTKVETLHN